MASFDGLVYLFWMSHSAAATKSSKTFCFFSNIPPWCQLSPNSPPPRRFGWTKTPPCSVHQAAIDENDGVSETLNPPYAVIKAGFLPSSTRPLRDTMNIGIFVPSFDGYQTCFTSMSPVWIGTLGWNQRSSFPVEAVYRYVLGGTTNEVKLKKSSLSVQRPVGGEAEPMPGSLKSPRSLPATSNCLTRVITLSR